MKSPFLVLFALAGVSLSLAEESSHFPVLKPLSLWDQAYGKNPSDKVYLYHNPDHPYIQGVNFLFRAQYQFGAISANQGSYAGSHSNTSEWRRFTLGGGVQVFKDFYFNNVWNIGGMNSMGYERNDVWYDHSQTRGSMSEIYVDYIHKGRPKVRVGKQFPHFFAENRHIGSDYNLPELPDLESQFITGSVYAVKVSEESPDKILNWGIAAWSNTDERSRNTWPTWQSAGTLASISSRVNETLMKKGRITLDWIHSTQNMDSMATARFRDNYTGSRAQNVLSLYYVGSQGPADLVLEALWAHKLASYRRGPHTIHPDNVFGIVVMPMYMLTEHIQAIARYEWSKGNDGVRLNPRYTNLSPTNGAYVDERHNIALGFNFFVYPEKHNRLKIMTLAQYTTTDKKGAAGGFTGWTFIGGIYTNF